MKFLIKFVSAALVGAFSLLAVSAAQAQVGVNINIGIPGWGPQVPTGTQYYYIPEIDGYYDLYSQQYIVYQDGYWVPLPQLYGYDPYQFHPVIISYRGRQPWLQRDYYHQHYAYQPYRPYQSYGPGRAGYYNGNYGRLGYNYDRNQNNNYSGGYRGNYGGPRGGYQGQPQQQPQQGNNQPGGGRGNDRGGFGQGQPGGGRGNDRDGVDQQPGGGRNDGGGRGGNNGGGNRGGGRGR